MAGELQRGPWTVEVGGSPAHQLCHHPWRRPVELTHPISRYKKIAYPFLHHLLVTLLPFPPQIWRPARPSSPCSWRSSPPQIWRPACPSSTCSWRSALPQIHSAPNVTAQVLPPSILALGRPATSLFASLGCFCTGPASRGGVLWQPCPALILLVVVR
jgi:hypothetical protein